MHLILGSKVKIEDHGGITVHAGSSIVLGCGTICWLNLDSETCRLEQVQATTEDVFVSLRLCAL